MMQSDSNPYVSPAATRESAEAARLVIQPDTSIVRVEHIHKYFRRGSERLDVLQDLTLEVPEGEFLGLMGPSGSGKTTLLNLIAGIDSPSAGEIWVQQELISDMSEGRLALADQARGLRLPVLPFAAGAFRV